MKKKLVYQCPSLYDLAENASGLCASGSAASGNASFTQCDDGGNPSVYTMPPACSPNGAGNIADWPLLCDNGTQVQLVNDACSAGTGVA